VLPGQVTKGLPELGLRHALVLPKHLDVGAGSEPLLGVAIPVGLEDVDLVVLGLPGKFKMLAIFLMEKLQ
jgi:hypothetical protein